MGATVKYTELESRIFDLMENYGENGPSDIYCLAKNIYKAYGANPTDEDIEYEIELFYNL